jgi:hypothetical protein
MPLTATRLPARLINRVKASQARHRLERDFERVMATGAARAGSGPRIGLATFGSGAWHFVLEALLAHALAARGARPEFLVCDLPDLPVCDERTFHSRHQERCDGCISEKRVLVDACGLPWTGLSQLIDRGTLERARGIAAQLDAAALDSYVEGGWPIGRWLHVSACHYLRCDARGQSAERVEVRRRMLATAIVAVQAVERWLDASAPEIVIAESGAHLVWRIALELARARGIPVVCREIGKGGFDTHLYSLDADCMAPDLSAAWSEAMRLPLDDAESAAVERLLSTLPGQTYVQRAPIVRAAPADLRARLGVPAGKRVAVAFTNVAWDLATAGRDAAFAGQSDWLRETAAALAGTDTQLLVRAHPAEASVLTREGVAEWIAAERPAWRAHVTIVPPEDTIAALDVCAMADLILVYNSHVGIEAAAAGHPVIVAGAPHYRARGFTIDVASRDAYRRLLEAWRAGSPLAPPPGSDVLARRYCHLFFLRYHIPMHWTTSPLQPPYELRIHSLRELDPGRNPSVDAVCDAILGRYQVVLPRVAGAQR